jgi:hypothetical protein
VTWVNPFISITPRKPLMSSGSWLTLHNCEIFYLLAVNYDPGTTDIIFTRVNIYPGPGRGGAQRNFSTRSFIRVTFCAALPSAVFFHRTPAGHTAERKTRRKRNTGCYELLPIPRHPSSPPSNFPLPTPCICRTAFGHVIRIS